MLKRIAAPFLTTCDGELTFGNCSSLEQIDLPALSTVGALRFSGLAAMKKIEAPDLTTCNDELRVDSLSRLQALYLPAITTVGALSITGLSELTTFQAPNLGKCGGNLTFQNCPKLTDLCQLGLLYERHRWEAIHVAFRAGAVCLCEVHSCQPIGTVPTSSAPTDP